MAVERVEMVDLHDVEDGLHELTSDSEVEEEGGEEGGAPSRNLYVSQLPDSEAHVCKYIGRLLVRASVDNPPDGNMCSAALRTLMNKLSRSRYREGVAKWLHLVVSGRRHCVVGTPINADGSMALQDGNASADGLPLHQHLLRITCVADHRQYFCYIAGEYLDGQIVCHAYAFECESGWAARYISEEIVKACREAFGLARAARAAAEEAAGHAAAAGGGGGGDGGGGGGSSSGTYVRDGSGGGGSGGVYGDGGAPQQPAKRTDPNEADMALYATDKLMRIAVRAAGVAPVHSKRKRVDGYYNLCCNQQGKCTCVATASGDATTLKAR